MKHTKTLLAAAALAALGLAAVSGARAAGLPSMPLQPKRATPARHLLVADVRYLPKDQQLMLASLQGLVNRSKPRLYLVGGDDEVFWLKVMQEQGDTDLPKTVEDPMSLLKTFKDVYKGVVVADPNVYVSPCVAVSIAGARDYLIATPELAAKYSIPIKADLRGRFKDDADALKFVRTTLLPDMNPRLSLCLVPRLLGLQVDDIIAAKGMCFWVTGPNEKDKPGANGAAEQAEVEALFLATPTDAIVRGYWWAGDGTGLGEMEGVKLASRYGKITTVSDYVSNFSVMSGVKQTALKQKPALPVPTLDPTKVYVALTMSDGDNLVTYRGFWRGYFDDPLHGTFPLGYGMAPTLIDLAPTMARWYYEHAAPTDEFFCDVSGAGYIYPRDWATALPNREEAFKNYWTLTQDYMNRMDLRGLRIMGFDTNPMRDTIAAVGADMPNVPFILPDYGPRGSKTYPEATYTLPTGQSVFRAVAYDGGGEKLAQSVRDRVGTVRPAFVNAFIQNWGARPSDLKKMLDSLGPDYVAVTPSQLDGLYRQSQNINQKDAPKAAQGTP